MKKTQYLKNTMLISLVLAFVLGCLPMMGNAQNEPTVFAIVDFMKVKPGQEANMNALGKKTEDSRVLVRSELWQVVDLVMKQ